MARARAQRRQLDDAVGERLAARELVPEMFHAMPPVKQLVADLSAMSDPVSDQLADLAGAWPGEPIGLPPLTGSAQSSSSAAASLRAWVSQVARVAGVESVTVRKTVRRVSVMPM